MGKSLYSKAGNSRQGLLKFWNAESTPMAASHPAIHHSALRRLIGCSLVFEDSSSGHIDPAGYSESWGLGLVKCTGSSRGRRGPSWGWRAAREVDFAEWPSFRLLTVRRAAR